MTTSGTLIGNTVLVELLAQILNLTDTGFEVVELGTLVKTYCQRIHITTRHTAIGDITLVHNAEHLAATPQSLITERHETTHIDNRVLLRRHSHNVGIGEHLAHDLLDRFVGITLLALLDEVGILGKASRVDLQQHAILAAKSCHLADICHRNGLTSRSVVGNCQHHSRDTLLRIGFEHLLQLCGIEITLKWYFELGILRLVDRAVDSVRTTILDMTLSGVEMRVAGQHVVLLDNGRIENILSRATLMRRQEVVETKNILDRLLHIEVRLGTCITLVAKHNCRPLAVAHCARTRVGQQVDKHLLTAQAKQIVMRLSNPLLTLGASAAT